MKQVRKDDTRWEGGREKGRKEGRKKGKERRKEEMKKGKERKERREEEGGWKRGRQARRYILASVYSLLLKIETILDFLHV